MSRITIEIQLDEREAKAYLRWLDSQYEATVDEVRRSNPYSTTPQGERGRLVLNTHPRVAGIDRSRRALRNQLEQRGAVR